MKDPNVFMTDEAPTADEYRNRWLEAVDVIEQVQKQCDALAAKKDLRISQLEAALRKIVNSCTSMDDAWARDIAMAALRPTLETPPHLRGPVIQAYANTNGVPPQSEKDVK